MGLRKRTWDTGMLSLSCAASPKFDEDGTSSHTHTHTTHTLCREETRTSADIDRRRRQETHGLRWFDCNIYVIKIVTLIFGEVRAVNLVLYTENMFPHAANSMRMGDSELLQIMCAWRFGVGSKGDPKKGVGTRDTETYTHSYPAFILNMLMHPTDYVNVRNHIKPPLQIRIPQPSARQQVTTFCCQMLPG